MLLRGGGVLGPQLALGPRPNPVVGSFRVPVLLGLFSDSPATPPFTSAQVYAGYFADAPGTVRAYYDEVSMGQLTLLGELSDWSRAGLTQAEVTGGESALVSASFGSGGIGNFIYQLLEFQTSVDWGLYDNDGPDGIPNSGDDDGYVDALAVIHPTRGDECGGSGDRIWAHKWNLSSALLGTTFTTSTPAAGGGFIIVDDYFVQGVESCSGGGLNEIGVFTHETGHSFGLPDLYDTEPLDGTHAGVGSWDLMASGTWGCNDDVPEMPCHMGAWTKAMLGWVSVTTLADGADLGTLVLPPVETTGTVFRVDANDGSGEYFLLENRQRIGLDATLFAEGLLIWHIDPDWVLGRWAANIVNGAAHRGVWLRQADGQDDLGNSRLPRGDSGDPFPGSSLNTEFHAASSPAALSYQGGATGLTIVDIQTVADDVEFRLLTRRTTVSLGTTGTIGSSSFFNVDGVSIDPASSFFDSAPFEGHLLEAAPGDVTSPGIRTPFVAWTDDASATRNRTFTTPLVDSMLVASYSGQQVQLSIPMTGGVGGIQPGAIESTPASPDLWFDDGQSLTVQALPRSGFAFLGWSGAFAGQPNPTTLTLNGPVFAGADFLLTYGVASVTVDLPAATDQDLQFEVVNGVPPITWSQVLGTLPEGLRLSGSGRVTGSALETGLFTLTLEARDATGLSAQGTVTLDVAEPQIPLQRAAAFFLLTAPSLTPAEMAYLDRVGNAELGYDLGDFRSWVLANPGLPLSSYMSRTGGPRTILLPITPGEREEGR
jgi:M6 family metalloprotease-like protein